MLKLSQEEAVELAERLAKQFDEYRQGHLSENRFQALLRTLNTSTEYVHGGLVFRHWLEAYVNDRQVEWARARFAHKQAPVAPVRRSEAPLDRQTAWELEKEERLAS